MGFNLGNYVADLTADLTPDEQNGALANVGSDFRVPTPTPAAPATQQPAIAQPAAQKAGGAQALAQTQKYIGATQGLTAQEGEKNGLNRALGLIGKIYSFGA